MSRLAVVELPLDVDLRQEMPHQALDDDETLTPASTLAPGSYDVYLRVVDAQGVPLPMQLAMDGRDGDGNYVLGSLMLP